MRLTDKERTDIKRAVHEFVPDARVLLFGSRVDDTKRGGDIDLIIVSEQEIDRSTLRKIKLLMFDLIGEQKIDILLEQGGIESDFAAVVLPHALAI